MVDITGHGGTAYSVYDEDRNDKDPPDGACWVVQRVDKIGDFYWYCLFHRSVSCEDVQMVKEARRVIGLGDRDPGDETGN